MRIHILTIGDELLIGQTIDTNSGWIGRQLNLHGAHLVGIATVGDDAEAIRTTLDQALNKADAVLITGGLGPTKDDITKKTLADYFGAELVFHQPTYDRILRIFERLERTPTEAHRRQCFLPANAELLPNRMGTAPGMWFEHQGKIVVSMPGVPYEMEYLMEKEVIPRLLRRFPGRPIAHRTLLTVGEGESNIAARLTAFEKNLPDGFKLAYLPNLGQVRLRLTATGDDQEELERRLEEKATELAGLIPDLLFGRENDSLEAVIGQQLLEHQITLGTAESCTGGYLAHRITAVPGSSRYFSGGVVSYSNELKTRLLNVNPETLARHGAVSEATVKEMATGALDLLGTDVAIAISGIAGPGGGTPEKPVGTIWMAVGNADVVRAVRLQAGKDRLKNIQYASVHALNLIRQFVKEQYAPAPV